MVASFFRDKKVLITGHTGFKGSWLLAWLNMLGAHIVGFSLPPDRTSQNIRQKGENAVSLSGDIRDLSQVLSLFKGHQPEIVFHLAAQSLVRPSYFDPITTFSTNVGGTVNILEAIRQTPSVRAAVIVTSDKCYENREWVYAYRENDPMGGRDPYSASKGCAELATAAYRQSFFRHKDAASIATARAGNVIGGGDWADDRIVPDIVKAIRGGVPAAVRNPDAVRPWQYVLEPLHGYLLLAERLWLHEDGFADAWNFGPPPTDNISVHELAEKVVRCWGAGELSVSRNMEGPPEAHYLKLDSSKSSSLIGWRPLLTLDSAIELTVAWYKAQIKDPLMISQLTEGQIRRYMELD